MEGKQPGQVFLLLPSGNHSVHKALFQLELCPLEACRQLLPDGLLNDQGAGKANQGLGLRQGDVRIHGKAGGNAAGGGVCEDGDIQTAGFTVALHRAAGLGHLHQ